MALWRSTIHGSYNGVTVDVIHGWETDDLNAGHAEFGHIEDPFHISDFGGWRTAKKEIVDGIWKQRVMKIPPKE